MIMNNRIWPGLVQRPEGIVRLFWVISSFEALAPIETRKGSALNLPRLSPLMPELPTAVSE